MAVEPTHDDDQRPEQHVDAELLELRLAARQQRRDVEAGGEPGGGDPEDADLGVDGAADDVGQHLRQRDAEERLALDRVVRGDGAHADLQQHQADDDEEVLARRLHRRRGHGAEQRVGRRRLRLGSSCVAPPCSHSIAAMPASSRMMLTIDHIAADVGHRVADQRLVRPVAGVREVGLARAIGRGGPRRSRRRTRSSAWRSALVGQRAVGHRVLLAQLGERRVGAEQAVVVARRPRGSPARARARP